MSDFSRAAWLTLLGIATLISFAFAVVTRPAHGGNAPHPHHGPEHFYATWMQPNAPGVPCCSEKDCAPARAEFRNGKWFARWTDDEPWVEIPDYKVEQNRDMPDGQAHLCGVRLRNGDFLVYCFGAGEGG